MNTYYIYEYDQSFPDEKILLLKIGADNMIDALKTILDQTIYSFDSENLIIEKQL